MRSSTDKNFMICLFDFERFSIESRFHFLTDTVYQFKISTGKIHKNTKNKSTDENLHKVQILIHITQCNS